MRRIGGEVGAGLGLARHVEHQQHVVAVALADRAAEHDDAVRHQGVHERRVLVPAGLGAPRPRRIPLGPAHDRDQEVVGHPGKPRGGDGAAANASTLVRMGYGAWYVRGNFGRNAAENREMPPADGWRADATACPPNQQPCLRRPLLIAALCALLATALLLPFAGRQLAWHPNFVPTVVAVVACFDAILVYLLIGDYRDRGDNRSSSWPPPTPPRWC